MKPWLAYVASGLLVTAALAALLTLLLGSAAGAALWFAATLALTVQALAFAALLAARRRGVDFVIGWGLGIGLRLMVILVAAWWVTRRSALAPEPALLGLVGFVFVLTLMEPLFLRMAER